MLPSPSSTAVVYASITGFGSAGGAALPGYDLLVQAMSGLMSLTGDPQFPAYRSGVAVFDVITGLHAAVGVLSALHERSQSGRGQRIEVNLMSRRCRAWSTRPAASCSAETCTRMGNEHPSIYPYEPLPTADGEIVLAIGNDRQFRTLCTVLGAPGLADDPRFETPPDRSLNRSALRPVLQELLAVKAASEWFDIFTEARLPCAPINDVRGGIDFAKRLGLEPVVEVGAGEEPSPA
jgi:crotonobetainyl-CoA:carnitine CoA-transferase CaiB-like acyl-CoA transferase